VETSGIRSVCRKMVAQPLTAGGGLRISLSLSPLGTAHHHIDLLEDNE
jgi:hypothetical protein